MNKKSNIPPKSLKQIKESASLNNVTLKDKVFNPTTPSHDFPEDCVTLDTFFSDLEDYIHQSEKI